MKKRRAIISASVVLAAASVANAQAFNSKVLYAVVSPGLGTPGIYPQLHATDNGQTIGEASGNYAVLWTSTGEVINLSPTSLGSVLTSSGYATDGSQQVGVAIFRGSNGVNAMLWSGTAASAVDLEPAFLGANGQSYTRGVGGGQQVGYGFGTGTGNHSHALLWSGTATSVVDLDPTDLSGFTTSIALDTDGTNQVGYDLIPFTGNYSYQHALLWSGTAGSAVDLNPTNLGPSSVAYAVNGGQEVGQGGPGDAMLWTGTASSAIDLKPANLPAITGSFALDTNGYQQVGYGYTSSGYRALMWSGTADSAVDLNSLLPSSGTWTSSQAFTIDPRGDVFGIANGTYNNVTGPFAVEWAAVPEPTSLCLIMVAAPSLLARRRRIARRIR